MTRNDTLTNPSLTTTVTPDLDALARRAPTTDDLLELADWLGTNGGSHLSAIERIELAERLITRRRFLIGAGALGLGVMTGCGLEEEAAAPTTTDADSADVGFRDFVDVRGKAVRVPDVPQRIVATHDFNAGAQVLSLGGRLVGLASRGGEFSPSVNRYFDLDDVVDIGNNYQPNLERIVELQPDLIVHEGFDGRLHFPEEDTLQALERIAPVVGIDTFRPVEEVIADYAELLGDGATIAVEDQQAALDGLVEDISDALGDNAQAITASYVSYNPGGGYYQAWGPNALPELAILTRAGVNWVPIQVKAGEGNGFIGEISLEEIDQFAADLTLVEVFDMPEVLDTPLIQQLPAVAAGQTILLDEPTSGTHYPNYIAVAETILEGLQAIENLDPDLVYTDEASEGISD